MIDLDAIFGTRTAAPTVPRRAPLGAPAPRWDQAEADVLLARARAAAAHAEVEHQSGRLTEMRRNIVRTWLEVAEGYARDHEREAARGWDALALLRGAVGEALKTARHSLPAGEEPGKGGAAARDDLEALRRRAEKAEQERGEFERAQAALADR
jgi:hypothetical protein